MAYAIITVDKMDSHSLRSALRDEHYEYLKGNQEILLAAGELTDDDGSNAVFDVLLVDTEYKAVAQHLALEDPFMKGDLFQIVYIFRWTKAFVDGKWQLPDK